MRLARRTDVPHRKPHVRDRWRGRGFIEAQNNALRLYPASQGANRAMVQMPRTICMIKANDFGGGLKYAGQVFDAMPAELRPAALRQLAHQVLTTTPAPERARPEAQELQALVSAPPPGAVS